MKYLIIFLLLFLCGCASPNIKGWQTDKGFEVKGNKDFVYEYKKDKEGNIEVKVDTKNAPIVNITTPDIEVGK